MLTRTGLQILCVLALSAGMSDARAQANDGVEFQVRYAWLMENAAPAFAEVKCYSRKPCQLLSGDDGRELLLSPSDSQGASSFHLAIKCGQLECSFSSFSGKKTIQPADCRYALDIYAGSAKVGVEIMPVIKAQRKIGDVVIEFSDPSVFGTTQLPFRTTVF